MNILILSWRGPQHPLSGGAEVVTHEYARYWAELGHTVTLFTSSFHDAKDIELLDGVTVVRRGKQLLSVQWEAFKWYVSLKVKPDVIVDHFHGIPFFTPLYARVPKIAFIHEVGKEVWLHNYLPFPLNYILGMIGYLSERFVHLLLYRSIQYITVSDSTKRDLQSFGISAKNISVLYNGISPIKSTAAKEQQPTLVYLGALAKDKGIEDALEIFHQLNIQYPEWKYWVVGKGSASYIRHLKAIVSKYKLEECVKFWGFVSEKKKYELLSRAHLLINPSKREGWGLVNIEANACKTPVVGYAVAGMVDSVVNGKTGILVASGNVSHLVEKIGGLLSDNEWYRAMQKNAYKWSNTFDWKTSKEKSITIVESVCKK